MYVMLDYLDRHGVCVWTLGDTLSGSRFRPAAYAVSPGYSQHAARYRVDADVVVVRLVVHGVVRIFTARERLVA